MTNRVSNHLFGGRARVAGRRGRQEAESAYVVEEVTLLVDGNGCSECWVGVVIRIIKVPLVPDMTYSS